MLTTKMQSFWSFVAYIEEIWIWAGEHRAFGSGLHDYFVIKDLSTLSFLSTYMSCCNLNLAIIMIHTSPPPWMMIFVIIISWTKVATECFYVDHDFMHFWLCEVYATAMSFFYSFFLFFPICVCALYDSAQLGLIVAHHTPIQN